MTKREGALWVFIHLLLGALVGMSCWFWQETQNTKLQFQRVQAQFVELQKRDKFHDDMIHSIIKTQALNGMFDTDARFIEAAERLSQIESEMEAK